MVKSPTTTVKFLCSYGGKIVPRHTDGLLRYSGGLTRYLALPRSISYSDLMMKLVEFCGSSMILRCQLPEGDLETLVAVRSDEDLANIIQEYDSASNSNRLTIRAVLSPPSSIKKVSSSSSLDSDYSPRSSSGYSPPRKVSHAFFRCYSPQAGYPFAAKLRYYPSGAVEGRSRFSYRVPGCH